jgi:hypothetical protein
MKAFKLTAFLIMLFSLSVVAQPISLSIPEGFTKGSVVIFDNVLQEGWIKNNLRKNGEIIFISADGKKSKFDANAVSIVTIDTTQYLAIQNAFYKVVKDGSKMRLLRKASQSSGIQYNGSEPIMVNTGEGVYDDYFIQTISTKKLQLVRKRDFQKIFATSCADCTILTQELKSNKISFADIEQAVVAYNSCGK